MKKILIPIIVFVGISINTRAQEKSHKELKGDKYYTIYAFDKAIDFYTHTKNLSVTGQRRLAESYHNLGQNVESDSAYSKLISTASSELLPEDYYKYAMVLKTNGNYQQAGMQMDKFVALKPNDLRAKSYVNHKGELPVLLTDKGKYKIIK